MPPSTCFSSCRSPQVLLIRLCHRLFDILPESRVCSYPPLAVAESAFDTAAAQPELKFRLQLLHTYRVMHNSTYPFCAIRKSNNRSVNIYLLTAVHRNAPGSAFLIDNVAGVRYNGFIVRGGISPLRPGRTPVPIAGREYGQAHPQHWSSVREK